MDMQEMLEASEKACNREYDGYPEYELLSLMDRFTTRCGSKRNAVKEMIELLEREL